LICVANAGDADVTPDANGVPNAFGSGNDPCRPTGSTGRNS